MKQNLTIEQMLDGTTPINTPKHNFKNIKEANVWAKKNIVGAHKNIHTDENINVSGKAIDKYLSASAVFKSVSMDAHLSALKQLPELIKTSILKQAHLDKENGRHIREIQRFYGAISYEDNVYPVKITVKVYHSQDSKAYSYEVMKIESPTVD
ncbi:MAG: hypothetical protein FWG79_09935 [Bacteroidales bacterium]|nr:hypothetical protein [Bacteroidales bacterium]